MKQGDILQDATGHLVEIFDTDYPSKGSTAYTNIEDNEIRFCNPNTFNHYKNLGSEGPIKAVFHMVKSIHLRLNALSKV